MVRLRDMRLIRDAHTHCACAFFSAASFCSTTRWDLPGTTILELGFLMWFQCSKSKRLTSAGGHSRELLERTVAEAHLNGEVVYVHDLDA